MNIMDIPGLKQLSMIYCYIIKQEKLDKTIFAAFCHAAPTGTA